MVAENIIKSVPTSQIKKTTSNLFYDFIVKINGASFHESRSDISLHYLTYLSNHLGPNCNLFLEILLLKVVERKGRSMLAF